MAFDFPNSPTANQIVPGPGGSQYQWDGVKWVVYGAGQTVAGVSSYNGRTGAVTETSADVTGALGYTPLDPATANINYVAKVGDTMTGNLVITPSPAGNSQVTLNGTGLSGNSALMLTKPGPAGSCGIFTSRAGLFRWTMYLGDASADSGSGGSATGSSFSLSGFNDANNGTVWMQMLRANGQTTFNGVNVSLSPSASDATLYLNKPASGRASTITSTTNGTTRWQMVLGDGGAESGSSAGSNFGLNAYSDSGALLGSWIQMWRASGQVNFNGTGGVNIVPPAGTGWAQLALYKPGPTSAGMSIAGNVNGSSGRWQMQFPNSSNETGGNGGSDFGLYAYSDTGVYLGCWMNIWRSNGGVVFNGTSMQLNPPAGNDAYLNLNKPASGRSAVIVGSTNGSGRWGLYLGEATAESGGNAGSNFAIARIGDNGSYIDTPVQVIRSNGQLQALQGMYVANQQLSVNNGATIANGLGVVSGSFSCTGAGQFNGVLTCGAELILGVSPATGSGRPVMGNYVGGSRYNITQLGINTAGTQAFCNYNGTANSATWTTTASDRRLKSNFKPAGDALKVINKLKVYDLDFMPRGEPGEGFPPHQKERWNFSLIADEIAGVLPYAAVRVEEDDGEHWVAFSPQHLCAVLWRSVQQLSEQNKTLSKRIAALEAR